VPWLLLLFWRLLRLKHAKGQRAAGHTGEKRKLGQLMRQSCHTNGLLDCCSVHIAYSGPRPFDEPFQKENRDRRGHEKAF
jgi:hypothetical protein